MPINNEHNREIKSLRACKIDQLTPTSTDTALLRVILQGFFSRNFNITLRNVKTKITTENCEIKTVRLKKMTTINYLFLHYIIR